MSLAVRLPEFTLHSVRRHLTVRQLQAGEVGESVSKELVASLSPERSMVECATFDRKNVLHV